MQKKRLSRGKSRQGATFPVAPPKAELPPHYADLFQEIKDKVHCARLRTVMAANTALVLLYWEIGHIILQRQKQEGWGARVIDRLSRDLNDAFPDMKGFSPRNLLFMRAFARTTLTSKK